MVTMFGDLERNYEVTTIANRFEFRCHAFASLNVTEVLLKRTAFVLPCINSQAADEGLSIRWVDSPARGVGSRMG